MRAVVRDAYYVFIILSNLLDIKLLELFKALSIYKLNKSILIIKEYNDIIPIVIKLKDLKLIFALICEMIL